MDDIWIEHLKKMANDEIPNCKMYEIVDQTGYGKNEVQIITPSEAVVEQAKYQLKRKRQSSMKRVAKRKPTQKGKGVSKRKSVKKKNPIQKGKGRGKGKKNLKINKKVISKKIKY
jgi:hypothetical protein